MDKKGGGGSRLVREGERFRGPGGRLTIGGVKKGGRNIDLKEKRGRRSSLKTGERTGTPATKSCRTSGKGKMGDKVEGGSVSFLIIAKMALLVE